MERLNNFDFRRIITTRKDLRVWVEEVTNFWDGVTDKDVDDITDEIRAMNHPRWGSDWSEFLNSLPDNLSG